MWISQQNHSQNVRGLVWVVMVSDNRIFVSIHARTHAHSFFTCGGMVEKCTS